MMNVKRNELKMSKRFVAGMLAIVCAFLVLVNPMDVEAATRGYGTGSSTIIVTTKADWSRPGSESITLKNTKSVFEKSSFSFFRGWKTKRTTQYPEWEISYKSTDGKHKGTAKMTGGSLKLKLKRNKIYHVTVSYGDFNWIKKGTPTSSPYWYVSNTRKATCR